jgi:hypothetical protein
MGYGGYGYGSYGGYGGYGYGAAYNHNGFTLLVVLFVLLIIVGNSFPIGGGAV